MASLKRTTRKRKLALSDFSVCHPRVKARAGGRCLPSRIYASLSRKGGRKNTQSTSIYESVGCQPGEEHCLLDKSSISDEEKRSIRKRYLRPKRPAGWKKDPDMWLDNYNIMDVMRQYEAAYPWFKFLGVFPIDFSAPDPYQKNKGNGAAQQCLYKETCHIDLKAEHAKGIRGIGMIFNLDPHFKSGSHWVALYIDLHDLQRPYAGYFDSYGMKTPPLIARLMRSFTLQIPQIQLGYNARRFQYSNTECGMFSLYYIICMIHGISFDEFCKDSVDDKLMLQLRNVLFRM